MEKKRGSSYVELKEMKTCSPGARGLFIYDVKCVYFFL